MEKNIKDYLHLHIGCEVIYSLSGIKHKLIGVEKDDAAYIFGGSKGRHVVSIHNVIPILRPLSDMTNDECDIYGVESDGGEWSYGSISSDCTIGGHHHILEITRIAEITRELCKAGFDCFELIEAGLAIDATKEAVK